ncbi:hypothetical protein B0H21DRAFT_756604 [Amylocystis lapponica]|nr:hypothetical protein B0H21DRAFT_756604 [Amylocystis lapponica]
MSEPQYFSAFFYGTLLHPAILCRVIGHGGPELKICPALLTEHTRHQIKDEDYPAVLPYSRSRALFTSQNRELAPEERTVRGTLVQGLTAPDIDLLDVFESDEYTREYVFVHPLGAFVSFAESAATSASMIPLAAAPLPPLASLPAALRAQTYIWARPLSKLRPDVWEYADFVRTNAWKWVGDGATQNEDYVEVDRRRTSGNSAARGVDSG